MDYYPTRTIDELRECETNAKHLQARMPLSQVESNVIDTLLVKINDSIADKHLSAPIPITRATKGGGYIA